MRLRIVAVAIIAVLAYFAIKQKPEPSSLPDSAALISSVRDQVSPFRFTLSTDPEPPSYGSPIVLRVHVMDAAGQPADGLIVESSVSMSGMDRGAQHTILHAKGNGVYEGRVNLDMAGSWDVDLTATNDGKRGRQRLALEVVGPQGNQGNIQPRNPNEDAPEP